MASEIQGLAWSRHKNVAGLNRIMKLTPHYKDIDYLVRFIFRVLSKYFVSLFKHVLTRKL